MIKISEVMCIRQFHGGKKEFVHGQIYKCYQKEGRYLVANEEVNLPLEHYIPGKLRIGTEKYFNHYFIEEKYSFVKNKSELKEYLKGIKKEFEWTCNDHKNRD